MSNRDRASARDAIEQQAADFVLALADGAAEPLRQAVADWLAQDPRHAVAFAKAERAWEEAGRLRGAPGATSAAAGSSPDSADRSVAAPKSR